MLLKSVQLPNRSIKCEACNESFTAKNYLDSHVRWKHAGSAQVISKPVSTLSYPDSDEIFKNECELVLNDLDVLDFTKHKASKPDNRKGRACRKSYTVEFKAKTLDLLDLFSERKIKRKWDIVGPEVEIAKNCTYFLANTLLKNEIYIKFLKN